jgi:hypothetical protein
MAFHSKGQQSAINQLANHGRRPPVPIKDDKVEIRGSQHFSPSVAAEFAEEIVTRFAADDPAVKEIVKRIPKPADRIPALKGWLRSKLEMPKKK